jgi:sterol desaturase/sphingolipid hydroxylase (fatty acid hydroxylase superfamily)
MSWTRVEGPAYWISFVAVFLAIAVWESVRPLRELSTPSERRWGKHGILLLTAMAAIFALRLSPVAVAVMSADNRFGVLNRPWLPFGIRCAAGVILLDFVQYWIHRSFHGASWLWRIHQVHHSDPDFDVSTGVRFHPLEVFLSQAVHLGAIALLSPPPVSMVASQVLTVVLNFSTHANASLPEGIERLVRYIFVSPDLHRIHHSWEMAEQQLNFGQTFTWWDRMFGTYAGAANARGAAFRTGLTELEGVDDLTVGLMLRMPFVNVEAAAGKRD